MKKFISSAVVSLFASLFIFSSVFAQQKPISVVFTGPHQVKIVWGHYASQYKGSKHEVAGESFSDNVKVQLYVSVFYLKGSEYVSVSTDNYPIKTWTYNDVGKSENDRQAHSDGILNLPTDKGDNIQINIWAKYDDGNGVKEKNSMYLDDTKDANGKFVNPAIGLDDKGRMSYRFVLIPSSQKLMYVAR